MRTTRQRVVPVRIQFGRNETAHYGPNGRLSAMTDVSNSFAVRLTEHALTELETANRIRYVRGKRILDLASTRDGRRKLRAMLHNWSTNGQVYGLTD